MTVVSSEQLILLLGWIIDELKAGASYDGSLTYEASEPGMFEVKAAIRTDNDLGQGGVIIV